MRRYGLQKKSSKNIDFFGRKSFSKKIEKYFLEKLKILKIFQYEKSYEFSIFPKNIFLIFFRKTFSIKNVQYFSMIFFVNHIYASRRIRERRFQSILSNLEIANQHQVKIYYFFVLNVVKPTLNFVASVCTATGSNNKQIFCEPRYLRTN